MDSWSPESTAMADSLKVAPTFGGAWMRRVYGAVSSMTVGTPLTRKLTCLTATSSEATARSSTLAPAAMEVGPDRRTEGTPSFASTRRVSVHGSFSEVRWVAVMVALPGASEVTLPSELTATMAGCEELQVVRRVLGVRSMTRPVTGWSRRPCNWSWRLSFTRASVTVSGRMLTPAMREGSVTMTGTSRVRSAYVTLTVASPCASAMTSPDWVTATTAGLLDS
ncbi:hypothetical protein VZP55_30540 [Myxococcus faecalis]